MKVRVPFISPSPDAILVTSKKRPSKASSEKEYEMAVTPLQAAVLCVFDPEDSGVMGSDSGGNGCRIDESCNSNSNSDRAGADNSTRTTVASRVLSFRAIAEQVGMTDLEALKRILHSLACQKPSNNVLQKTPTSRKVEVSDTFTANVAFTSKVKKLRILMAALEDTGGMSTNKSKAVSEERNNAIDAAVVRTMKARKVLTHAELQVEIIRQVGAFLPDTKTIKQRLESLIERDYLERLQDGSKSYKYVP